MTIAHVYAQYRIMPCLQQHQLRVAAVADLIIANSQLRVNRRRVITALLLHDMGNIIKFDLDRFPQYLKPEGKSYWQQVRAEYLTKYGQDVHHATLAIVQELGVTKDILKLIDAIDLTKAEANVQSDNYEIKICDYADARVAPTGIVSLQARFDDLHDRYQHRYPSRQDQDARLQSEVFIKQIESQIFADLKLKPEDITDQAVSGTISQLSNFKLKKS